MPIMSKTLLKPRTGTGRLPNRDTSKRNTASVALYAEGNGVPEDYVEAIRWLRMAAEQGYAEAHYGLGVMYERSVGVPENDVQAYAWYIVACC